MTEQPADEVLVRKARGGDVQAFGLLYDRTIRLVRAVAADAGPDAEDVTHDVYIRAYQGLGKLREASKFSTWLVGIARLVVRERRRMKRFDSLTVEIPERGDSERFADEDHEILLRAVARLPEHERLAVRFFFLNERSIEETAKLLDRSRSGTYAVLQSAKAKLARWLNECGVAE